MRNTLIKVQNRDGSRFQAEALQHEAGTHIRAIQALLGHCSSRLIWKAPLGSQTLALAGEGLLKPLRLISGEVMQQYLWNYRVVEDSGLWVLQSLHDEVWQDL